jgi:hypothetical protein
MMNADSVTTPHSNPCPIYEIKLKGRLGPEWSDWFDGLTVCPATHGETILTGLIVDQSALPGLLNKVRNLGLPLLAVNCRPAEDAGEENQGCDYDKENTHDD